MSNLTEIKYVGIEVIKKDGTGKEDITSGLFLGIWDNLDNKEEKQRFLVVMDSKTTVRLFNTQFYNVLTFKVLDDETEYLTVFKKDKSDQTAAIEMLDGFVDVFRSANKLMATDATGQLIDPNEYSKYPEVVLEGKDLTDTAFKPKTDFTKPATKIEDKFSAGRDYNYGCSGVDHGYGSPYNQYNDYSTPKVATVTYLTRKGAPLAVATLDSMKDKVMRLATGDYEVINIPVPSCDEPEIISEEDIEIIDDDKKNLPAVIT